MSGLELIRRAPPRLFEALLQFVLPVILVVRFLIGRIVGIGILSLILYWSMWHFGESKPLTLAQLALWIDDLPDGAKTAFVTVILTVLGFLVAFHTATANWKAETLARMQIEIAGQLDEFFSEVLCLADDAMIFAERLLTVVEDANRLGRSPERDFKVQYEYSKASQFLATRDRLVELGVQVHHLGGRHGTILLSIWGAPKALDDCQEALSAMTHAIWVKVPFVVENNPDRVGEVIRQLDATEFMRLLACFEENKVRIAGLSGALRGALLQPLANINFAWIAGIRRQKFRAALVPALERIRYVGTMEDEPNGILRLIPGQVIGTASSGFPKPGPDQPETMEAVVDGLDGRGMVRIKYRLKENRHGKSSTWAWMPVYAEAASDKVD